MHLEKKPKKAHFRSSTGTRGEDRPFASAAVCCFFFLIGLIDFHDSHLNRFELVSDIKSIKGYLEGKGQQKILELS